MDANQLSHMISQAYPVEPSPGPDEVLCEGAHPGEQELEEIKAFFAERPWNRITPQDVFRFRHALSFFSAFAFVYFTPAWLTCALLDEVAVDTGIEDFAGALTRHNVSWTEDQRRAICKWLKYYDPVDSESARADFISAMSRLGRAGIEGGAD